MNTRITTDMIIGSTLANINAAQATMTRSQEELASGKSILEPSDNPYGTAQALTLQSTIDGLSTYEHGTQDGLSWMNTSSSALASINSQVQRVRELVLQGASGINNPGDLEDIAEAVEQLTEGIKQDADTQYAGQYVFSGTQTETAPYKPGAEDAYQGNAGAITRALAPGSSVNVAVNLSSVLGNGATAADGKLLDTLRTIATQLREGTPAAVETLRTTDLHNLDTNINALTGLQAEAGAVTDQLQLALTRISSLQDTATTQLANVQDANMAQVSIEFSNEHAAFEAALRAGASIVQESLLEFLH
jgi:flagellar hook-associated protein 3 FlgL